MAGTIPDYQDFQIFGDIEETDINNEGINVGASTPAHEDTIFTKKQLPRNSTSLVPQLHSLEEKAIWKLLVILDSMECPDYAFETITSETVHLWVHGILV